MTIDSEKVLDAIHALERQWTLLPDDIKSCADLLREQQAEIGRMMLDNAAERESFSRNVSLWRNRAERYRRFIEEAPHDSKCAALDVAATVPIDCYEDVINGCCDCWKSRALNDEEHTND